MARVFKTVTGGKLVQTSDELKLKVSLTDDYHNGSIFGQNAAGRQRWGDYSQVSIDPTNESNFWVIGEFAREYNLPQFGHPGGTGGSRWGTWIAKIYAGQASVPEPASWALMLAGFGLIGGALRRQRRVSVSYAS
ncbi:PEP-CTERM sorting domain-containing protein [Chakrabartia godavariana]|nr:PEP-CTERM sorting domain-containing protein [Chakrabartia godavariana]